MKSAGPRNFTHIVKIKNRFGKIQNVELVNRGLKLVHIGDDVWRIGKSSYLNGKLHQVIYGPDRKEYHVYGNDVEWLSTSLDEWEYTFNRHGNSSVQSNVKIYILTRILDEQSNWCFDLTKIPKSGIVKVIYHNGTIKNVQFDGIFEDVIIEKNKYSSRTLKAVGYRIK